MRKCQNLPATIHCLRTVNRNLFVRAQSAGETTTMEEESAPGPSSSKRSRFRDISPTEQEFRDIGIVIMKSEKCRNSKMEFTKSSGDGQTEQVPEYGGGGGAPNTYYSSPRWQQLFILRPPGQGNGSDEEEKCCHICLDEEDPDSMIAPCKCTGIAKWVHRSCLDLWRENEKDRAFAQCTECGFHYHFDPTDRTETQQFWRRTKFCLFVSRDL